MRFLTSLGRIFLQATEVVITLWHKIEQNVTGRKGEKMDRHILGTFRMEEELIQEIQRLINEEGYQSDELMVIIDSEQDYDDKLKKLNQVVVKEVELEDDSIWEKIKDTFSFGSYNSNDNGTELEDYGVASLHSDHYTDALRDGDFILLADTNAPKHAGLSEVNEEVIDEVQPVNSNEKGNVKMDNDEIKKDSTIDEVNTEEEQAITSDAKQHASNEENPSQINTSETDSGNMDNMSDATQASSTRKEDQVSKEANAKEDTHTEEKSSDPSVADDDTQGTDSKEEPEVTGDEKSVIRDYENDEKHEYGSNIAKGSFSAESKSPLNTEDKEEKDPSEESETPETDAVYPESHDDAGMKSEENQ